MFQTMSNARTAYGRVGLDMGVETATPHKLILMLYDGALLAVTQASASNTAGDKPAMSEAIMKADAIIAQGLRASLDTTVGGELAERLGALYDYMCVRLQFANLRGEKAIFDEVAGLLQELRSAWQEIAKEGTAVSPSEVAANG